VRTKLVTRVVHAYEAYDQRREENEENQPIKDKIYNNESINKD